jgi:hypothetical protein
VPIRWRPDSFSVTTTSVESNAALKGSVFGASNPGNTAGNVVIVDSRSRSVSAVPALVKAYRAAVIDAAYLTPAQVVDAVQAIPSSGPARKVVVLGNPFEISTDYDSALAAEFSGTERLSGPNRHAINAEAIGRAMQVDPDVDVLVIDDSIQFNVEANLGFAIAADAVILPLSFDVIPAEYAPLLVDSSQGYVFWGAQGPIRSQVVASLQSLGITTVEGRKFSSMFDVVADASRLTLNIRSSNAPWPAAMTLVQLDPTATRLPAASSALARSTLRTVFEGEPVFAYDSRGISGAAVGAARLPNGDIQRGYTPFAIGDAVPPNQPSLELATQAW